MSTSTLHKQDVAANATWWQTPTSMYDTYVLCMYDMYAQYVKVTCAGATTDIATCMRPSWLPEQVANLMIATM